MTSLRSMALMELAQNHRSRNDRSESIGRMVFLPNRGVKSCAFSAVHRLAAGMGAVDRGRHREMSVQPDTDPEVDDEAPNGAAITGYDERHFITYLRLLDAAAQNMSWRDAARTILHRDPVGDTVRSKRCWKSHLARARWMSTRGYRQLL